MPCSECACELDNTFSSDGVSIQDAKSAKKIGKKAGVLNKILSIHSLISCSQPEAALSLCDSLLLSYKLIQMHIHTHSPPPSASLTLFKCSSAQGKNKRLQKNCRRNVVSSAAAAPATQRNLWLLPLRNACDCLVDLRAVKPVSYCA